MLGEIDREKLLPLYVKRTGYKKHQYQVIRNDGYPAYQISVCTGGEGKFISDGKEHVITEGDIFMFSPRAPHEYYPTSQNWSLYFFVFLGDCADNLMQYCGFNGCEVFSSDRNDSVMSLCRNLSECDDEFEKSKYIYELFGIMRSLSRPDPSRSSFYRNEKFRKTAPVIDYIKKNYKEPISLDELAELIDVSKSYLCRVFKEAYSMTPINYLLNYRIDRAKQLLISTDMKMRLLCDEVGFNDTSYFCMAFKRSEGMTPEEFRNLHND